MGEYVRKGKSYRGPSPKEKEVFRQRCIDGLDPVERCPICTKARVTREARWRYDNDDKDFKWYGYDIACHTCGVRYGVVTKEPRKNLAVAS